MTAPEFQDRLYTDDFDLVPLMRWDAVKTKDGAPVKSGKSPMHKDWVTRVFPRPEVAGFVARGHNYGVRLKQCHLIVDVDPRNMPEGRDTFAELCEAAGIDPDQYPCVRTGSGGLHVYMWKPEGVAVVNELPDFKGVEFKSYGRQVVAAGSLHPDTGRPYEFLPTGVEMWESPSAPDRLLTLIDRSRPKDAAAPPPEAPGRFDAAEVAAMLKYIDPAAFRGRDAWLELMMACHHASAGAAIDEWTEWATSDPEFSNSAADNRTAWESLGKGTGVTAGTLIYHAKKGGWRDAPIEDDDLAEWVWVAQSQIFIREREGADKLEYKKEAWKSLYAEKWQDGEILNAVWKGKTPVRKFERSVYEPGKDRYLGRDLNLWTPSGIVPTEGDVTPFVEHMQLLLPDDRERELFLDYLHFIVCHPSVKLMFAALLQGEQGVGKSLIGNLVIDCIGRRNVSTPTSEIVKRDFTGWQEGCSLILVEELMTEGRMEVANKMKRVITEPTLQIERKGIDAYDIPNRLNLLCFTNHKDAVRLEGGDRRWFVLFSPMKPQTQAYYDRLFSWLAKEQTAPAFMHWLGQRRPVLLPKGRAPDTEAKATAAELSLNDTESRVLEWFESKSGPFENDLFRFDDVREKFFKVHPGQLTRALELVGAVKHPRNTNSTLPNIQLWSIRNHAYYAGLGPADLVREYQRQVSYLSY